MRLILLFCCFAIVPAAFLSADIVADFTEDFVQEKPSAGWSYHYNPEGVEIGEHNAYIDLAAKEYTRQIMGMKWRYVADVPYAPVGEGMPFQQRPYFLTRGFISPGLSAINSADGKTHYIIAAYTIQKGEAGMAQIVSSSIHTELPEADFMIRIYVNDRLIGEDQLTGEGKFAFDVPLGQLEVNDVVYVALGRASVGLNGSLKVQYQIETK